MAKDAARPADIRIRRQNGAIRLNRTARGIETDAVARALDAFDWGVLVHSDAEPLRRAGQAEDELARIEYAAGPVP